MNVYQRAYLRAFMVTVVLCWSPLKAIAYVIPLLALGYFILATRSGIALRNAVVGLTIFLILIGARYFFQGDFVLHSALLSIVTFSAAWFLIAIPVKRLAHPTLLESMVAFVARVTLIEGLVGIVQAGYGFMHTGSLDQANGDFVTGTIHIGVAPDLAFSNPMFATNMTCMLLILLPDLLRRRKHLLPVLVGALALVLSSVVHVIVMGFVALVLALFLVRPKLQLRLGNAVVLACLAVIPLVAVSALSKNLGLISGTYQAMFTGEYPRTLAIIRTVFDLPSEYPLAPLIGLGPGQYSSRASLIGTGYFFGGPLSPKQVPLLPKGMSPAFERYLWDLWLMGQNKWFGSTQQPFCSWLTLFSEFGVPLALGVMGLIWAILWRVKARADINRHLAFTITASILFLCFLGVQENYWEVPQAIMIGCMLIQVAYASLVYGNTYAKN
ncbi:hypothetical protein J7643_19660 [bacterium]|nr:hypothetical protein [bacterium]